MLDKYNKIISKTVKEYESDGYKVIISPNKSEVPESLKDNRPDIVAYKGDELIIIEIKTSINTTNNENIKRFAEIAAKEGYRFDLISTENIEKQNFKELKFEDVREKILSIKKLIQLEFYNEAFITAWSCLEAVMREKCIEERIESTNVKPVKLIKTLYSYGVLEEEKYNKLIEDFRIRNTIVHGMSMDIIPQGKIEDLINIVESLIE